MIVRKDQKQLAENSHLAKRLLNMLHVWNASENVRADMAFKTSFLEK